MQNMPWKENTKPHLSENVGSEQRGDKAVRARKGERGGGAGGSGTSGEARPRLDAWVFPQTQLWSGPGKAGG